LFRAGLAGWQEGWLTKGCSLNTTVEKPGDGTAKVRVEISIDELNKQYDGAARRISGRANIPGFRRGKAPKAIVERMYGREMIVGEAVEKMVPAYYEQALKKEELFAIDQPEFDIDGADSDEPLTFDKPFVFTATVPLRPTAELGEYSAIELTRNKPEVKDEDVEAVIEQLREARAETVDVEDGAQGLKAGDIAELNLKMLVDGENQFGENSVTLSIGQNGLPEGFDMQVEGMTVKEERVFSLEFSGEHTDSAVAGKTAEFEVELLRIRERILPEANDEFAKLVSDRSTLRELRDQVREQLLDERETMEQRRLESDALDALVDKSDFEIPESLVHREAHAMMEQQVQQMTRSGIALDTYLRSQGLDQDSFHDQAMEQAVLRLRRAVALDALASKLAIDVKEEDLDAELERMAEGYPEGERDAIKQSFVEREGQERLSASLRERFALEALLEAINIDDPEATDVVKTDQGEQPSDGDEHEHSVSKDNDT
tara:strand:- start:192 stop:1655 length:1464 start_codon:yes stop_codon:yes gene_type:complete